MTKNTFIAAALLVLGTQLGAETTKLTITGTPHAYDRNSDHVIDDADHVYNGIPYIVGVTPCVFSATYDPDAFSVTGGYADVGFPFTMYTAPAVINFTIGSQFFAYNSPIYFSFVHNVDDTNSGDTRFDQFVDIVGIDTLPSPYNQLFTGGFAEPAGIIPNASYASIASYLNGATFNNTWYPYPYFLDNSGGNAGLWFNIESIAIATVPEPATYAALAGVAALGITAIRRRRHLRG